MVKSIFICSACIIHAVIALPMNSKLSSDSFRPLCDDKHGISARDCEFLAEREFNEGETTHLQDKDLTIIDHYFGAANGDQSEPVDPFADTYILPSVRTRSDKKSPQSSPGTPHPPSAEETYGKAVFDKALREEGFDGLSSTEDSNVVNEPEEDERAFPDDNRWSLYDDDGAIVKPMEEPSNSPELQPRPGHLEEDWTYLNDMMHERYGGTLDHPQEEIPEGQTAVEETPKPEKKSSWQTLIEFLRSSSFTSTSPPTYAEVMEAETTDERCWWCDKQGEEVEDVKSTYNKNSKPTKSCIKRRTAEGDLEEVKGSKSVQFCDEDEYKIQHIPNLSNEKAVLW